MSPAGSGVVGFAKGAIYAARTDQDDVVHLQRFTMP